MMRYERVIKGCLSSLTMLLLLLVGTTCNGRQANSGHIEVRIWDHREAIGDFHELQLAISTVRLHPVGQPRTDGWIELESDVQMLDLTQYVDGTQAVIVQAPVEAGHYAAIHLRVDQATGRLTNGERVPIAVQFEPVALAFQIEDGRTTTVGLDLVVFDVSDHPGRGYELQIREALVMEGN